MLEARSRTASLPSSYTTAWDTTDSYHRTAATKMRQTSGLASISSRLVFRIGWEWNNGSKPWKCNQLSYAPAYKTYWARVAGILKEALPGSRVDWSCARKGSQEGSVDAYYPGSIVDFLGPNGYDFYPSFTSQSVWDRYYNAMYNGGPAGYGSWLSYARGKGKKLSIGEWGLIQKNRGGGGDNPYYIGKMLQFCRTNAGDIAYECYFNKDTGSLLHRLDVTYPNACAEYKRQMAL